MLRIYYYTPIEAIVKRLHCLGAAWIWHMSTTSEATIAIKPKFCLLPLLWEKRI